MRRRALVATAVIAVALTAGLARAETVQMNGLRITVRTQVQPYKLPRDKPGPIAVFLAGALEPVGGEELPQLQRMRVLVNRAGLLRSDGLPVCRQGELAAASSRKALDACADALVGSGMFWAHIVLPDQGSYPTRGRLLVFNGRKAGRPALLAHIFTANPFNTAFTIAFAIRRVSRGRYGTELKASFPDALGSWGYLDRIKLTLRRKYRAGGRVLSYFNAACRAPAGVDRIAFPLARVTLAFPQASISADIDKSCGVKG